jgi:hypothetical protein
LEKRDLAVRDIRLIEAGVPDCLLSAADSDPVSSVRCLTYDSTYEDFTLGEHDEGHATHQRIHR